MSDDAYRQVRGKIEMPCDDIGLQTLKNIVQPMRVWRVQLDGDTVSAVQSVLATDQPHTLSVPVKSSSKKEPSFEDTFGFFPNRSTLRNYNLKDILGDVKEIKMILVGGFALTSSQFDFSKIKQAILPHPSSSFMTRYVESVGDYSLPTQIIQTTDKFRKANVGVRWCQQPIGQAITIVDPTQSTGWMQAELVLPHMELESRPRFKVRNSIPAEAKLINEYHRCFDKIFERSVEISATRSEPTWIEDMDPRYGHLKKTLRQTYAALGDGLGILAAIGIRTCLDIMTQYLGIDSKLNFKQKIDRIHGRQQSEKDDMYIWIDGGNAAAHRMWDPPPEYLVAMIDALGAVVIDKLLHEQLREIKDNTPQR